MLNIFTFFSSYVFVIPVVILALLFCLAVNGTKEEQQNRFIWCFVSLILLFAVGIYAYVQDEEKSYQLLYTLPIIPVVALAATEGFRMIKKGTSRFIWLVGAVVILVLSVGGGLTTDNLTVRKNTLGVDDEIIEICDVISQYPGGEKILAADSAASQIRRCTSKLELLSEPSVITKMQNHSMTELQNSVYYMDKPVDYVWIAVKYVAPYVVIERDKDDEEYMKSAGFVPMLDTDRYRLYIVDILVDLKDS